MAPPVVLKPTFADPSEEDRGSIPAPPVVLQPTVADPSEEELNPTPVDTAMNVAPEAGAEVARLGVGTEVAPETGLDAVNSADWQGWPIREKKSKKVAKAKKLSESNAAAEPEAPTSVEPAMTGQPAQSVSPKIKKRPKVPKVPQVPTTSATGPKPVTPAPLPPSNPWSSVVKAQTKPTAVDDVDTEPGHNTAGISTSETEPKQEQICGKEASSTTPLTDIRKGTNTGEGILAILAVDGGEIRDAADATVCLLRAQDEQNCEHTLAATTPSASTHPVNNSEEEPNVSETTSQAHPSHKQAFDKEPEISTTIAQASPSTSERKKDQETREAAVSLVKVMNGDETFASRTVQTDSIRHITGREKKPELVEASVDHEVISGGALPTQNLRQDVSNSTNTEEERQVNLSSASANISARQETGFDAVASMDRTLASTNKILTALRGAIAQCKLNSIEGNLKDTINNRKARRRRGQNENDTSVKPMSKASVRKAEAEVKKPQTIQERSQEMWNKWKEELNNQKSRPILFCFLFGSFSSVKRVDGQLQFLTFAPASSFVPRDSIKTREDWDVRAGAMSSFIDWAFKPYRDSVHKWFTRSGFQCVNCENPAAGYTYHYNDCLYEWETTFTGNLAGIFRLLITPFCSSSSGCYNIAGQTCVGAAHEYGFYPDPGKYLRNILEYYYSHCQGCNTKSSSGLTLCGSCNTSPYCSRECQVKSWPAHKQFCKSPKRDTLGGLTKKFGRVEGNLQAALRIFKEARSMEEMMRESLQGLETLSTPPTQTPPAEKGKLSGLPISQCEHVMPTQRKESAQVDTVVIVSSGIEIPLSQVQFRSSEDYRRHNLDEIAFIMNMEATLLWTSKRWPAVKSKG